MTLTNWINEQEEMLKVTQRMAQHGLYVRCTRSNIDKATGMYDTYVECKQMEFAGPINTAKAMQELFDEWLELEE